MCYGKLVRTDIKAGGSRRSSWNIVVQPFSQEDRVNKKPPDYQKFKPTDNKSSSMIRIADSTGARRRTTLKTAIALSDDEIDDFVDVHFWEGRKGREAGGIAARTQAMTLSRRQLLKAACAMKGIEKDR